VLLLRAGVLVLRAGVVHVVDGPSETCEIATSGGRSGNADNIAAAMITAPATRTNALLASGSSMVDLPLSTFAVPKSIQPRPWRFRWPLDKQADSIEGPANA
jgi:hypothetical protein